LIIKKKKIWIKRERERERERKRGRKGRSNRNVSGRIQVKEKRSIWRSAAPAAAAEPRLNETS